jgi:hypothetical protein
MTQLSRPFQVVLVAFALFVAVWFVALRGHAPDSSGASGSGAPSSPASSPTTKPASTVTVKRSVSTSVHRPEVVHTTIVVRHPHAARPVRSGVKPVRAPAKPATATVRPSARVVKPAGATVKSATGAPSMQATVEHELAQGKTVLILFWNSQGFDDVAVHKELPTVQHALGRTVAVHYASASQVGAYGTITHAVQITQTPTLLIVNQHGQTTVLTGLTDAFSIEQAVGEARKA